MFMEAEESMGLTTAPPVSGSSDTMHVQRNREASAPHLIRPDATRDISTTPNANSSTDIPISRGSAAVPIVTTVANYSGATDPQSNFFISTGADMPTISTGILSFSPTLELNAASAGVNASGVFTNFMTANVAGSGGAGGFANSITKKKRGRPRKYGPGAALDITCSNLALTVTPIMSSSPIKRGRGRPPGTGKNQQLAALGELMSGSAGMGFTPHAITIATGEDIASTIMSLSQQGPRAICVLSANGAISRATLRQPSTAGGAVTYEGRFELLSLSGSFLLTQSAGDGRSRTGGLSVSLAGPDGRVFGGGVSGALIAASPVQIIVGSFVSNSKRLQPPVPPKVHAHAMKVEGLAAAAAGAAAHNNNEEAMSTMKFAGDEGPAAQNLAETSSNTDSPED